MAEHYDRPMAPSQGCRLLTWALVALLLGVAWSTRAPAKLAGVEPDRTALRRWIQQAEAALAATDYQQAQECYQRAHAAAGTPLPQIQEKLTYCTTQTNIEARYQDRSVVEEMQQLDAQSGKALLRESVGLIRERFHGELHAPTLMTGVLRELSAALDNPVVMKAHHLDFASTGPLRTVLAALEEELRNEEPAGLDGLIGLAERIAVPAEAAGLPSAWVYLESAYALAAALDRYGAFLSPAKTDTFYDLIQGAYVGIGVDLRTTDDLPVVFDVLGGSAADEAGLISGDRIVAAEGVSFAGQSGEVVSRYLRGREGTTVTLAVRRGRQDHDIVLTRRRVRARSVRQIKMLDPSGVGYFRIATFDQHTAVEVQRAWRYLGDRGATMLIIDLRNNAGGMLSAAVDTADLFLTRGDIVTVENTTALRRYTAERNPLAECELPAVLLVNQNTASAAEIFSAALKDHQRATIIGQNTRGKAVVQTVFPLSDSNHALRITTAGYLPPSGVSFADIGLVPDIVAPLPDADVNYALSVAELLADDDPALMLAKQSLTQENPG